MLVCNENLSFECSKLKTTTVGDRQIITFDIFRPFSPDGIKSLFADNTFYFHDEILNGKLPYTENTNLVGLRIAYNADSTCKIRIKLTQKGVVDDEG